jgi:hypothetical protein
MKKKKGGSTTFEKVTVPGAPDKRLAMRAGEFAEILVVCSQPNSTMPTILRDAWDGKPLRNQVKGMNAEGITNSARCEEPHVSISADITPEELKSLMPKDADNNGFANRFNYVYVYATKECAMGGPQLVWSDEIARLRELSAKAKDVQRQVPLTHAAEKLWARMYAQLNAGKVPGIVGQLTGRSYAHIRRFALILALLDGRDEVGSAHLQAGKRIWDYCAESVTFVFHGMSKEQHYILRHIELNGAKTDRQICDEVFHRNQKMAWVRGQIKALVDTGKLYRAGDKVDLYSRQPGARNVA